MHSFLNNRRIQNDQIILYENIKELKKHRILDDGLEMRYFTAAMLNATRFLFLIQTRQLSEKTQFERNVHRKKNIACVNVGLKVTN